MPKAARPATAAIRVLDPGSSSFRELSLLEENTRVAGALLRAHDYVGVFHPSGAADPELILRGLRILRVPGKNAQRLIPVVIRSRHATLGAWVRGEGDPACAIDCDSGWLVMRGEAHPPGGESTDAWCERGFRGDWAGLIGADGSYTCALHEVGDCWLALAQDRFGAFRQVYTRRGDLVWFATSTNALAVVPGLELRPNREHIVARGVNVNRPEPDAAFLEIQRPLPNSGHLISAGLGPAKIHRAPGCFPRDPSRPLPRPGELVERLNAALLARLEKVVVRPDLESVGLWLTSGVDSRWIAAGLRKLGVAVSYWTVGAPTALDVQIADAYGRGTGGESHCAVTETLDDVARPLPESNWWLEGCSSLWFQFTGSLWEELRQRGALLLQGHSHDYLKWVLPEQLHRRVDRLGEKRSLDQALDAYVEMMQEEARRYRAHLLMPEVAEIVESSVRAVIEPAQPRRSYQILLAMQFDGGPVERVLTFTRLAQALGGADIPLMDSALVDAALEATRHPYPTRRSLQPRCIERLDPVSARLPTTPWSLPPRAMTGSVARVAAYALAHPAWLPRMIQGRRRKTIYAYPSRMRILGGPELLEWARGFLLDGSSAIGAAFGQGVEALCDGIPGAPKPSQGLAFLWGLVALELYVRAWKRAARGIEPPWEPLALPTGPEAA